MQKKLRQLIEAIDRSNRTLGAPACERRVVVSELMKNCFRMLAKRRHGIHPRREPIRQPGRQQRGDAARRGVHIDPAVAGFQLFVCPHFVHVVHAGIRDLRVIQAGNDLRSGQL